MEQFLAFCKEHRFAILLTVIGLVIAIFLMTIGFWRTILLVFVVGLFLVLGVLLDKNGPEGVRDFFSKLFSKKE